MLRLLMAGSFRPLLVLAMVCLLSPMKADEPDNKTADASKALLEYDALITDDARDYWAFQPIERHPIPPVKDTRWPRNPIDNFVLSKLEENGWRPAAPVTGRVLLRRVWFDLVGLPPDPDEQQRFVDDRSPDAFERTLDALLAHPGYGERWGRHWLDLVRFAETNGYERDAIKPEVWRFRDYVIRAFNSDKPYDRFVVEQLAGDELADSSTETVIATGFYRLGPWDDEPADFPQDRADQMDDMVRTTSRVFLGLTLGCSRCHNHKFDPLTMHDYYRMVAIFDPLHRPYSGRADRSRAAGSRSQYAAQIQRDRKISKIRKQIAQLRAEFRAEHLLSNNSKLPAEALAAFRVDQAKRSGKQKELVEKFTKQFDAEVTAGLPEKSKSKIAKWEQEIQALRRADPDLPQAYVLQEPTPNPPATHLLLRGRAATPGSVVEPGVPAVLVQAQPKFPASDKYTTRRRLTLARWLTSPENPLAARVIVNRVWQYHFGEGLVSSSSDFGTIGSPPTHPELLDWLADWFVHEGRWSLKNLHRLILTSSTYRMSKQSNSEYLRLDPENELLWRVPYRRLEIEAIRDSMLSASGHLNQTMYGLSTYLSVPKDALAGSSDPGKIWKPLDEPKASRRTVYAFIKRSMVVPMLEVMDLCDSTRSVEKRKITSVPTQALTLYNGEFVNRQARHFALRLRREAGNDRSRQIQHAYLLALCRKPKPQETASLITFLEHETAELLKEAASAKRTLSTTNARHTALERMCRVIFNLNEFVYTD